MRFYKILKAKQCGNAEGLTAYERQFVEYLKKIDIKTITGVLPLTFTAKGGTAVDWVIEGNDDNGTENLFDVSKFAGGNTHTSVGGLSLDISNQTVIINSTSTEEYPQVYLQSAGGEYLQLENLETYTISLYKENVPEGSLIYLNLRARYNGELEKVFDRIDNTKTITVPSGWTNWRQLLVLERAGMTYENCKIRIDIVKGSTAPDHYIPYQQGVGERTEQFINCSTISGGVLNEYGEAFGADATTNIHADSGSISFTTVSAWRGIVTDYIDIKSDVNKITLTYSGDRASNWRFCFYDNSQTFISQAPDIDRQTRVVDIPNNTKYFRASAQFETAETYSLTSLSIIKGSTAPTTYIPYGYQIPLTVSQTGQTDKTVDIYIGDSPLTEGETVSKTSTGVDIELFEGENTVSTTLYNKPQIEIKYK